MKTFDELCEEAFNKDQGLTPPIPYQRLNWQLCKEMAERTNHNYDYVYENLRDEIMNKVKMVLG